MRPSTMVGAKRRRVEVYKAFMHYRGAVAQVCAEAYSTGVSDTEPQLVLRN